MRDSYFTHFIYSHLSNKREVTLTNFEKFHLHKKTTLHVYWFLRFFPPSTPRLLHLCTTRLFQPPRLLERWEYSNLTQAVDITVHYFGIYCKETESLFSLVYYLLTWSYLLLRLKFLKNSTVVCRISTFPVKIFRLHESGSSRIPIRKVDA